MNHAPSKWLPLSCCVAMLTLLSAMPALADLTLGGGARAAAMGGAGLASGDAPGAATLNPAFLAKTGVRFGVEWPTINARMQGASLGDALNLLGRPSLSPEDALDLAIDLGDSTTRLDATASAGLLLPKIDLRANAAIRAEIVPNEAFQAWARSGGTGTAPVGAEANVYAGGVATLPSLGVGLHVPMSAERSGRLAVGVRLKPTQAYYSHYVINADAVAAGRPQLAAEMGGHDYLKRTSFAADLGLMYNPPQRDDLTLALVVDNLIEPQAIDFGPAAPAGLADKQLAPRSISLGAALVRDRITLAADLVDISQAYGNMQFRLGAEMRLPAGVALRGGYNTASGFTIGAGIGGLGVAYSEKVPITISETIAF